MEILLLLGSRNSKALMRGISIKFLLKRDKMA